MKTLLAVIACLTVANVVFAGDPVIAWEKTYDSGNEDWANGVVVGPDGNIVVLGGSVKAPDDDQFHLIKYDTAGTELWHRIHDPGANDWPLGLAVDLYGNYFTVGGYNNDFYTVDWDVDGSIRWTRTYPEGDVWAYAVACDQSANAYVVGVDFLIVKYDMYGNLLWHSSQPSLLGCAYGVAVAPDGSVYVGGYSGSDNNARVIKFDSTGTIIWNKTYGSDSTNDFVDGIAVDDLGHVYCTGTFYVPPTGPSMIRTFELAPSGDILWKWEYGTDHDIVGEDIAVDDRFVYVLGEKDNGTNNDLWVTRCDKNDADIGWTLTKDWFGEDEFYGIASDNAGNFYVAGATNGDLRVVKYFQDDFYAVAEKSTPKPALGLEARFLNRSAVALRYSLPAGAEGTISIYNLAGRLVQSFYLTNHHSPITKLFWDTRSFPSGIYFCRLESGQFSAICKVVVLR